MKPAYLALSLAALFLTSPAYAQAPVQVAFALDPPVVVPDEQVLRHPAPHGPTSRWTSGKGKRARNGGGTQSETGDRRYAAPVDWTPNERELAEIQASKADAGVQAPPTAKVPEPPKPPTAGSDGKPKPAGAAPAKPAGAAPMKPEGAATMKPEGAAPAKPEGAAPAKPATETGDEVMIRRTPAQATTAPTLAPPKLESPIGGPAMPNVPVAPPVSVPGPSGI
jgi:hypothetical protein